MAPRTRSGIKYCNFNPDATLSNLPVELLELINEHLQDICDIQNLRLVCRSLEAAAWRSFGRHVILGPFRLVGCSLARLRDISDNQAAANNLRSIVFGTERLHADGVEELKDWVEKARTKGGKDGRRQALLAYRKMFVEQKRMENSGGMYQLLYDSFQKFSKIDSIGIYSPMNSLDVGKIKEDPQPLWPGIKEQKALDRAQSQIPDLYDYYAHKHVLRLVLAAVAETGIHLKELTTTAGDLGVEALKVRSSILTSALKHLETLRLVLNKPKFSWKPKHGTYLHPGPARLMPPHLPNFLRCVPSLTTLDLRFPIDGPEGYSSSDVRFTADEQWFESIQQIHFPHLQKLVLREFQAEEQGLSSFLVLQASTLRTVHFHTCTLMYGNWAQLLQNVANGLSLEEMIAEKPWVLLGMASPVLTGADTRFVAVAKKVKITNEVGHVITARPSSMAPWGSVWARDKNTVRS